MNNYSNVYFIGIGGIGMSAIARYYHFKGCAVSGYDRTPSDLTHALEAEGIAQVKLIDATPIGINVRSTVATYANVHDELRKV